MADPMIVLCLPRSKLAELRFHALARGVKTDRIVVEALDRYLDDLERRLAPEPFFSDILGEHAGCGRVVSPRSLWSPDVGRFAAAGPEPARLEGPLGPQ